MRTLHTRSKTSPKGVLNLALSIGLPSTDVDVVLVVSESVTNEAGLTALSGSSEVPPKSVSSQSWNDFVSQTAGAWDGELSRPPQGEFEQREFFE